MFEKGAIFSGLKRLYLENEEKIEKLRPVFLDSHIYYIYLQKKIKIE